MGKKGKKSRKKVTSTIASTSSGSGNGGNGDASTRMNATMNTVQTEKDSRIRKLFKDRNENFPAPDEGWAQEFSNAKHCFKKDKTNVKSLLRLARAQRKMRLWEELKLLIASISSCSSTRTLKHPLMEDERQELYEECLVEANYHLSDKSLLDRNADIQSILKNAAKGKLDLDKVIIEHQSFNDLNALQWAAVMGDVRLLEKLISLGAAFDHYKHEDEDENDGRDRDNGRDIAPKTKTKENQTSKLKLKPVHCSALTLAMGLLAADSYYSKHFNVSLSSELDGVQECALILIRLGARLDLKLCLPKSKSQSECITLFQECNLDGKSVKEMAMQLPERQEIVDAVTQFDKEEHRKKFAYCRCGSRLPWSQCHYSEKRNDNPYFTEGKLDAKRGDFRFSPRGPCPCKNSTKEYFNCCWDDIRVYFMCDRTGEIYVYMKVQTPPNPLVRTMMANMEIVKPTAQMANERKMLACSMIRSGELQDIEEMWGLDSRARLDEWDNEVHAGIVERLDNWFLWRDDHYIIAKAELLNRVKEWNEALEQYCNDVGLQGDDRRRVIELHTVSPMAPCANPTCNKYEKKVKSFSKCSRCKSVAYCGVECQKQHWKSGHKRHCH